ncbi:hypothetical protein CALCODRAFT_46636 [Calocera cornea HHB12733]|uniref:Uncharacterized protein n=1 Tax=Calocera cornea HHB12733 TaxID=1353952 RepID=A0A165IZT6_9BASI|nr:hypothetical protein CALCODRAFT_46636 [Calocera cornea HHB12733]
MPRPYIPSLYFTKRGSAASWYIDTDTEMQILNGIRVRAQGQGQAAHGHDLSVLDEDADADPDDADTDADSAYEPICKPVYSHQGVPSGLPRVDHDCPCTCHDSPEPPHDHGHGHGSAAAQPPKAGSSRSSLESTSPTALVHVPLDDDETRVVSPGRTPSPPRTPSPSSSAARTPSLARTRSSSDLTRESTEAPSDPSDSSDPRNPGNPRNSFLRSWSERCSSGWWRVSIASIDSASSASTTTTTTTTTPASHAASHAVPIPHLSKPLPARTKRSTPLPAHPPSRIPHDTQREHPGVWSGFGSLRSSSDLDRQEIMFSPAMLACPPAIYSARPASSQIGVAI